MDEPRYLARGTGYTKNPVAAMDKLEAVDEREQSRQTLAARRKAEREQRQEEQVAWSAAKPQILDGITVVRRVSPTTRSLLASARALSREVDRVDRELAS